MNKQILFLTVTQGDFMLGLQSGTRTAKKHMKATSEGSKIEAVTSQETLFPVLT